VSVSEPPAPNGSETDDDVALDVEVVEDVRLPPVQVQAPPPQVARSAPPRPPMRSAPPRPTPRSDRSDATSLPIAAMPIIQLGAPSSDGDSSVEVASTGLRRSSLPPPPPGGEHQTFSEIEEEVTPLRTRAPADSLVQAIPSPRPPEQSDPNVERPTAGRPAPAAKTTTENGSAAARAPLAPLVEPETLPDEMVDSEQLDSTDQIDTHEEEHAEEIEPEPDSTPGASAVEETAAASAEDSEAAKEETAVAAQESPGNRISENPPEVDPADLEIHESASQTPAAQGQGKPPPVRLPLPLPLYARGAELAAAVQAQQATETPAGKRARYWWDEMFGDDFLRTMDRLTDSQIKNEVNFIEDSLGVQKGGIILDLACGGGRHAVELGVRGYNVVGYDLSLAMLARAADEAQDKNQKLNFLHGDMRDMGFEEMFDGVYCWSTSFGYFDDEKNQLVAQKIHRALRTGGMLLLDVANRDFVAQRQPSLVWFEGEGCVCMDEMRVDFITSRLKVKRMVILDDGRTRELDYSIRLYTLHELGRMLHDVGFKVTEVSGHPATPGVFMGADSPRLLVLAEKA
jgi:SAM-dependent methyltransferase